MQNTFGPLLTKRTDILPQDLVKSRGREIDDFRPPSE